MRKWSLIVLSVLLMEVLGEEETKTESEKSNSVPGPSPRDPMAINYYPSRRERPPKLEETLRLPGSTGTATKPTKYHYYPHNQHIYLLPECAVQQVCNAVYVRLNYTQPLCACPSRYREPCSASLNSDDLHTTELSTDPKGKILTLVKTCEPVSDMRLCRSPRDWSLLALQNIRTGKSHYLVICRCPDTSVLEGPMSHDQPTYASVPGIRVYGMMCVNRTVTTTKRRGRPLRVERDLLLRDPVPKFPWYKVDEMMKTINIDDD
ncbi:doublesex cognate 73A [Lycorma delicatula]|uniref:doublesex cognate 73A n=1 Tax=Lycorma delicatula TaxID=130591 RepID=UPI003F50D5EC